MNKIKAIAESNGSAKMNLINLVEESKQSSSLSEIPRNINQVYNYRRYSYQQNNKNVRTKDEYADALINRLKSKLLFIYIIFLFSQSWFL